MKRSRDPLQKRSWLDDIGFYKILGVTALIHAIAFLVLGFLSGPFSNPGYLFAHLANGSVWSLRLLSAIEIVFSFFYLVPVFLAFRYDLLHEKRPTHLLAVLLLELFIFVLMRSFEYLGGNLVLFLAAGIALCFLIGGSSLGIFLFFDAAIASGSVLLVPLAGFILPLLGAGILIKTLADFFA